jgi:hypothetical protein
MVPFRHWLAIVPTYGDALHCSMAWSRSRPDDLRLTREREVPLGGEKK